MNAKPKRKRVAPAALKVRNAKQEERDQRQEPQEFDGRR